jgi:Tol biopolymer transport system component
MNPSRRTFLKINLLLILGLFLSGCASPRGRDAKINVSIEVDGRQEVLSIGTGSTVSDALRTSDIELGLNDEVNPPGYTILMDGMKVTVVRVEERFEIESVVMPFERQIIKNEAIPEGETHILQPGSNGLEEITYRIVEEDGWERIRVPVKRVVVEEPIPEILMIGTQRGYAPITFSGTIAYISSGNVWLIDGATGNRRPVVSTGDLDGRILKLSPDSRWLLFTRSTASDEEGINTLWLADLNNPEADLIDLDVENVIHYAEWSPQSPSLTSTYTLAYSTVEPRLSAPGWQANNDLQLIRLTEAGTVYQQRTWIETNPGGQFGWWGTNYSWSPDGSQIAYSRADSIGLVDVENGSFEPLIEITPYSTLGDWAWVPPIAWGPDSEYLYFVRHGEPLALEEPESSQVFDVMALTSNRKIIGPLVRQAGMFSHLAPSMIRELPYEETSYLLAFLQAVFPLESETSHYSLVLMDHDGSNRRDVFPPQGEVGLEPGQILWSPDGSRLAILYQGDLWIIDSERELLQRMSADGQTSAFDWRS